MPPARDVADGEGVRLWRTPDERKRYDDFATLYALARALEKLERAYVRSSVDAKAYERACVDLTSKFKTLRSVLRDSVPDLDRFLETYGARVPAARRRLEAGGAGDGGARRRGERHGGGGEGGGARGGGRDALLHRSDGHGEAGHAGEG